MLTSGREVWDRFYTLARRVGVNPKKVLEALLTRWMDAVEDDLRAECLRRQIQVHHGYRMEVQMPRAPRKPAAQAPAQNEAKTAAESAAPEIDPLAGLDAAADPLAGLDSQPTISLKGLDSLAEGVTPEAIAGAISAVTGGASSAGDAVAAKALIDLKEVIGKQGEALTVIDNRLVAQESLVQKSTTALAQTLDNLATELRQSVMGLQATLRGLQEFVESALGVEEGEAQEAPSKPAVAPSGPSPRSASILGTLAPALAAKGNPAYPAGPAVWEALAAVCNKSGMSVASHEVEAAFAEAGRVKDGKIAY